MKLIDARKDHYRKLAHEQGFRSRAAFKLKELNQSYRIIGPGFNVLDLGCAPGGWTQMTMKLIGNQGKVMGVDLSFVEEISGAYLIRENIEDELEEQLTEAEIENFQIEKVDMERLTNKICDILAERESDGMLQSELWKKLKLTSRDGSRLSLKLERMGTINRVKLLENDRWTYKLILKKTPISTQSIERAPCLVCTVEQKCSLDGEISPKTCQLIEDWVIAELKKPLKAK